MNICSVLCAESADLYHLIFAYLVRCMWNLFVDMPRKVSTLFSLCVEASVTLVLGVLVSSYSVFPRMNSDD
jgi:hypothetical protein